MKAVITLFFFSCIGCNLDINTSDPQASRSIEKSKGRKVFLKEYSANGIHDSCIVFEAWVEYAWRNEVKGSTKTIKTFPETQLMLIFDWKKFPLDLNKFSIDWEISDSLYGKFGSGNGGFILDLKENELPDKFTISLNKRGSSYENICIIYLYAK